MVHDSVFKCDIDMRVNLLSNIVLSGGGTMLKGKHVELTHFDLSVTCVSFNEFCLTFFFFLVSIICTHIYQALATALSANCTAL